MLRDDSATTESTRPYSDVSDLDGAAAAKVTRVVVGVVVRVQCREIRPSFVRIPVTDEFRPRLRIACEGVAIGSGAAVARAVVL